MTEDLKSYEATCDVCGVKHTKTQLYAGEGFHWWAKCPTCQSSKMIETANNYHFNTFTAVGDILVWKPMGEERNFYRIELPGDENRWSYGWDEIEKFSKVLAEVIEFTRQKESEVGNG